jgi:hypothetical protein
MGDPEVAMIPPNRYVITSDHQRPACRRTQALHFQNTAAAIIGFLRARALGYSQNIPDRPMPKIIINLSCIAIYLAPLTIFAAGQTSRPPTELRIILLHAQHLGAHGMGYGETSLHEFTTRIQPDDIPSLIELHSHRHWRTAATFALASQCQASIEPTRDAAMQRKLQFFEAQEVMDLIAGFAGCSPDAKEKATAMRSELGALSESDQAKAAAEAKVKAENDARIQRNALKMTDPKQAAHLTRQEREEVYHRSLKAMGIDENGPLTPQQRDLVDRMYRTMVLGEPSTPKPQ